METEKIERIRKTALRNINMMLEKGEANNITSLIEICRLAEELSKEVLQETSRYTACRECMEEMFYYLAVKDERFSAYLKEKTGTKKKEVFHKKVTLRLFTADDIVILIRGFIDGKSR